MTEFFTVLLGLLSMGFAVFVWSQTYAEETLEEIRIELHLWHQEWKKAYDDARSRDGIDR